VVNVRLRDRDALPAVPTLDASQSLDIERFARQALDQQLAAMATDAAQLLFAYGQRALDPGRFALLVAVAVSLQAGGMLAVTAGRL
jgi:hypothetical protein